MEKEMPKKTGSLGAISAGVAGFLGGVFGRGAVRSIKLTEDCGSKNLTFCSVQTSELALNIGLQGDLFHIPRGARLAHVYGAGVELMCDGDFHSRGALLKHRLLAWSYATCLAEGLVRIPSGATHVMADLHTGM
jgi:hypothetical protein